MRIDRYFASQTVLLTGASGGIGAAMALRLGEAGARVLLVARSETGLAVVAEGVRRRGGEAVVFVADLEIPDAADALCARLAEAGERVDVLVNNAGFGASGPFLALDAEAVAGQIALNVSALTVLTHRLAPGMIARGRGGVLNVSSLAGFVPAPRFAEYAATKAYVLSLTDALHHEWRGTGVHATCLCPGPVRTGFGARGGMDARFFAGGLTAERVAEAGLKGLARNTMRVVPGWLNKAQALATRFVPPTPSLYVAEATMRKAV